MEDCIFCKIIKGEIPSYTIYEDDIVKVFMDINPISNGHSMVVPKKHTENLETIDFDVLNHIDEVSKKMYKTFKEKLNCSGLTRMQNNGYGQDVKHYHLHLVPRYENDGLEINHNEVLDAKDVFEKIIK